MAVGVLLIFFGVIMSLSFSSDVVQAQNGLDYIVITDAPNATPILDMTYHVGDKDTYYCSGYNYTQGFIGLEPCAWFSENEKVGTVQPKGNATSTTFTAVGVGVTRVSATIDVGGNATIYNYTGILTVNPSQVDYIVAVHHGDDPTGRVQWIGDTTYNVGETDYFYAMAYNNTLGELGFVDANWTTTNSTVCGLNDTGTTVIFRALAEGTCKVTAEYLGKHFNTTGTLTVVPGLDFIEITDSPGGNPIGNMTYYLGDNDTFYCSGYNNSRGFVGLEECFWYSEDWRVGRVDPEYGTTVTFITVGLGSTWVIAYTYEPGQNQTSDSTGVLNVVAKNIDYIVIVDSENIQNPNQTKWVGNRNYSVDDTDRFYAAAYNNSLGPLGLVSVNWTTSNSTVCSITTPGTYTDFEALKKGNCTVRAEFEQTHYNTTGTLTVTEPGLIIVDGDGSGDYKTIQEAIDAANPGDKIFVRAGTYPENVIVNKTVKLEGEDKDLVIVTGGGSGTVFLVTADSVSIKYFTIRDGYYGIFSDKTDGLVVSYNIIKNYTYGMYQNKTTDSWVTYNDIMYGSYGIVTWEAHNDAIRYNFIAYNTVYGAKDYNSQLKNCFNWNTFRKNKVAYYYDPDQELSTLEFDGNVIEDNEIGIMVEGASTVDLTNNTIKNNDVGIQIIRASPLVYNNTLIGNKIGILCELSSSLILQNVIIGGEYGIKCEDSSPQIERNDIRGTTKGAIQLFEVDSGTITDNEVDGGNVWVEDSSIDSVSLLSTEIDSVNSNFGQVDLDSTSLLRTLWQLKVIVLDDEGRPVTDANVWVNDSTGSGIAHRQTGPNGWVESLWIIEKIQTSDGIQSYNPYLITATKDQATGSTQETIEQDKELMITILRPAEGGAPWLPLGLLIALGSVAALGAGLAAFFSSEVGKFALLSLIVPLYMKLRKGRLLDNYDRGRVYQYIEMNPGEHYNQIKRDVGLANGSLVHHLTILEKAGKIRSRRDGRFRRFYTTRTRIPRTNGGILTEVQKRVVDAVKDIPGVTQKEISSLLGVHQSSVNYQMTKLEERGLIRVERKGRKVHYYYVGKK